MTMEITDKYLTRFMSRIEFFEKNKCWQWIGPKNGGGYGSFKYQGKTIGAHRFSYLIAVGEIKNKMYVCHTCDNRSCVNPEHLFIGTQSENIKDAVKKKRQVQSKKTHCPSGHPYSAVYYGKTSPARYCRICKRKATMKSYYKKDKNGQTTNE